VFDAIVLAGGSARRLDGVDKPAIEIDGRSMLDRVIAATDGAHHVVVVGPERALPARVRWVRENPPGGGPVSAIAAGIEHVGASWTLVLAADLPWVAPAVPLLLSAATDVDVAVLATGGRRNYLAAVWRTDALRTALSGLTEIANAAARDLYTPAVVTEVTDDRSWGQDCDTWDDIERARKKAPQ
jgi:molybdopterin-guanine dinucleotide biosynthesis protein A